MVMRENGKLAGLKDLRIKIFADGADLDSIQEAYNSGLVKGFTTNPTLMAKAGVTNYLSFAREMLRVVPDLPVSFEVFSDEFGEMKRQAKLLAVLGPNVYVKIPVMNTRRESSAPLVRELVKEGLKLNVTALFSLRQVREVADSISAKVPSIVSVFAGRIADAGQDPVPLMAEALKILRPNKMAELLWASSREALNIVQAEEIGCHIITVTPDLISKAKNFGRDLEEFSLDTVKMFYNDAKKSGFTL